MFSFKFKQVILFLFLLSFILSRTVFADLENNVIILTDKSDRAVLSEAVFFLEDEGNITIDDIRDPSKSYDFKQIGKNDVNLGYKKSAYWFKFKVLNKSEINNNWILEFQFERAGKYVELYIPDNKGGYLIKKDDSSDPHLKREINYRNTAFVIDLGINESKTIYVRVVNKTFLSLRFVLWKERPFYENTKVEYLFEGASLGIVIVLALYNLLIWFLFKDDCFIYYALTIVLYELVSLSGKGTLYEFLPLLEPIGIFIYISGPPMLAISLVLFARRYLEFSEYYPKFDLFLKIIVGLTAISIVACLLFDNQIYMKIRSTLCAVSTICVLIIGPLSYFKGSKPALYFSLAIIPSLAFGLLPIFVGLKLLPLIFITRYGIQIGGMLLVSLLSVALVLRLKESATLQH